MSGHGTHVHWGMVINNYDDTDLALLAEAYPDHIRKLVYTKEVGEGGTPHIQAFIKMKRDCRLSHMRKLFPKGHFNYLESLEYKLNAERYAQKQDQTADGPSVITNGDPLHSIEGTIRTIALAMIEHYGDNDDVEWETVRKLCEMEAVQKDYTMAKIFVSATYKSMWKDFGHDMYQNILHTHTHTQTHSVLEPTPPPTYFLKEYKDVGVQTDGEVSSSSSYSGDVQEGGQDDCSDGSASEGDGSEGSHSSDSEGSDCS